MVKDNDSYAFRANVTGRQNSRVSMIVTQNDAFGIKDIKTPEDIYKLDITRITRIGAIVMMVTNKLGTEYYPIEIKDSGKYGAFTEKFLEYIITNGYALDSQDRYVIDVTDWRFATPVIKMPQIEYSFLQLSAEVKNMLKTMKVVKDVRTKESPETILQQLFDLINSKLDVNLALLEVLVYAFTINNMESYDYQLGRNRKDQEIADIKHNMHNRSLGGFYAWEYVAKGIASPLTFSKRKRTNHPLDVMMCPNETVAEYTKKN